ncbi:hypothetical protein TL16_g11817 [Triparma laevis f. inornata]|uniref:Uncharacterized protein n=1 Tax=Triparma laevis f. inornata TaxID=1714386 RepID=A0A9W7EU03_9STRA|nr:hypothetical protein TL16_g11817 [Triparma laevis f. inornata]
MPSLEEFLMGKALVILGKSIPSIVLQMTVMAVNKEFSYAALISILASAAAVGFTSASISYDADVSPQKQRKQPFATGYLASLTATAKFQAFVCMMIISAIGTFMRSVSLVFLSFGGVEGSGVTRILLLLGAEIGALMIFKVLSRDFTYWIPTRTGLGSVLVSLVFRAVTKFVCDFSMIFAFLSPTELGGPYFFFNIFASWAVGFSTVYFYFENNTEEDLVAEKKYIEIGFFCVFAIWLAAFTIFLSLIDRGALWILIVKNNTQIKNMRSRFYYFQDHDDDELCFDATLMNKWVWNGDKKLAEDVWTWLANAVEKWRGEGKPPEWLTLEMFSMAEMAMGNGVKVVSREAWGELKKGGEENSEKNELGRGGGSPFGGPDESSSEGER